MGTERSYQRLLVPALRARGFDVQEHEDRDQPDIPDLSFAIFGLDGWIELKNLKRAPRKFAIDNFTSGQRNWLISRGSKGCGAVFLVVNLEESGQVAVFTWESIAEDYGKLWLDTIGTDRAIVADRDFIPKILKNTIERASKSPCGQQNMKLIHEI